MLSVIGYTTKIGYKFISYKEKGYKFISLRENCESFSREHECIRLRSHGNRIPCVPSVHRAGDGFPEGSAS